MEKLEENEEIIFKTLINKLVHVFKSVLPEKMKVDEEDTRANVKRRSKRDTALTERTASSDVSHVRHPRKKLHHRNFDQLFSTQVREGEKREEKGKETMKNNEWYLDHPSGELNHGNFESIYRTAMRKEKKEEKDKEIMTRISRPHHSESKTDAHPVNDKLVPLYLQQVDSNANGTMDSVNAAKNASEFVKITRLTSLDVHLPVLMAFFFVLLLAVLFLTYICYFCVCYLRRKKEREKERPFTLI